MNVRHIHDLQDFNDPQGRTHREVNLAKTHKFKVGDLVEIPGGVRVYIHEHRRDCDGTPLYVLAISTDTYNPQNAGLSYGQSEDGMTKVTT